MKKNTIRYYSDQGRYLGWEYVDKASLTYTIHWLKSGNEIRYKEELIKGEESSERVKAILRNVTSVTLKKP